MRRGRPRAGKERGPRWRHRRRGAAAAQQSTGLKPSRRDHWPPGGGDGSDPEGGKRAGTRRPETCRTFHGKGGVAPVTHSCAKSVAARFRRMGPNHKDENENRGLGGGTSERREAEFGSGCPCCAKERHATRPLARNGVKGRGCWRRGQRQRESSSCRWRRLRCSRGPRPGVKAGGGPGGFDAAAPSVQRGVVVGLARASNGVE